MKKIIVLIAASAFVLIAFVPKFEGKDYKGWEDKYCAVVKDGAMIMMNGKSELFIDVTLENGSTLTTDGYVISKDGTRTALKDGDCVDKAGNIIQSKKNKENK